MLVSSSHDIDYYILRCVLYIPYVISRNAKNIDLPNSARFYGEKLLKHIKIL